MQSATICAAVVFGSLCLANAAPDANAAAECDIAILNGRVMDPETKFYEIRNVCVKEGVRDRGQASSKAIAE